jgi:hypothetical protein
MVDAPPGEEGSSASTKSLSCTVPDVKDLHSPFPVKYAVDDAINVRFASVEQVTDVLVLRSNGTSVRKFFEAEDLLFKPLIPVESSG